MTEFEILSQLKEDKKFYIVNTEEEHHKLLVTCRNKCLGGYTIWWRHNSTALYYDQRDNLFSYSTVDFLPGYTSLKIKEKLNAFEYLKESKIKVIDDVIVLPEGSWQLNGNTLILWKKN